MTRRGLAALAALAAAPVAAPGAQAETMRMAVTTSFQNSGLSDVLLPAVERALGLRVRLVVVGTGQALRLGRAGDVDAVLVHSRSAEDAFVAAGFARHRREIMYNDFVLIGPAGDPAGVARAGSAAEALAAVARARTPFVSRGDDSGTHRKERALWRAAKLDPEGFAGWYRPVGAGMGAALAAASAMDAYLMADRASWLKFGAKGRLRLLYSGDPALFNQYAYLPVNPDRHPHVAAAAAARLEDWLAGPEAKALVDGYAVGGARPFTHNAGARPRGGAGPGGPP